LNCIFADCFGEWFISISFVGDDVAKCRLSVSCIRYSKRRKFRSKMHQNALGKEGDRKGREEGEEKEGRGRTTCIPHYF